MWEQIKSSRSDVVISLKYYDFATILVEKKFNGKGLPYYEVTFHIEEVTDQSLTAYNISDVSRMLEKAKDLIEDLYEDIVDYSDKDVYDWIDDFLDAVNDY